MNKPPYVIVTGASGGLGSALCETLLDHQWSVLGIDRNSGKLEDLKQKLGAHFNYLRLDLENPDLENLVRQALPTDAPIKGLAYLAAESIGDSIENLSDADWDLSFKINVTPAMKLARLLAPLMQEAGGGSIVNVGSPVGIVGARKPSYASSKAALTGLTISLARNLGSQNIRANLFLPGPMITPMTQDWPEEKRQTIASSSFLKRLCEPVEAARAITFLLSDQASYLTGSVLDATAGSMFGH